MTEAILACARKTVASHPFPRAPRLNQTALFIVGHGTARNQKSRVAIETQVEAVRRLEVYAEVHALLIEEEPRVERWHELTSLKNVVVAPFFISDGLHSQEDIPVLLGESERIVRRRLEAGQPTWRNPTEKRGKLLWYAPSVGNDPLVTEIILARVEEMVEAAVI
jgi:sirohydrochlorin cobaltochelatase